MSGHESLLAAGSLETYLEVQNQNYGETILHFEISNSWAALGQSRGVHFVLHRRPKVTATT
jgi:hypothetical protein